MLKIRLSRRGKKAQKAYYIVVQEHTSPIKGKFIEKLGTYIPTSKDKFADLDLERVKHWVSVGAKPTDSIAALLVTKFGMDEMKKFMEPRDKKRKPKKEQPEEAPAAAPASEAKADSAEKAEPEAKPEEAKEEAK